MMAPVRPVTSFIFLLFSVTLITALPKCHISNNYYRDVINCECDESEYKLSCNLTKSPIDENHRAWSEILRNGNQFLEVDLLDKTGQLQFIPHKLFHNQRELDTVRIKNAMLFTILPGSFTNMPELQRIFLSQNKIQEIAWNAFVDLPRLYMIEMNNNQIQRLRKNSFVQLPALERIYLAHNELREIEGGTFSELGHLNGLNLEHNKIRFVNMEWWTGLRSIQYIDLHDNSISSLSDYSFGRIPTLEYLYLANNRIKSISQEAFSGLEKLKILGLNDNLLEAIEDDLFVNLRNLQTLNLNNNNIKVFTNTAARSVQIYAPVIEATGNDFICNCDIKWMVDLMKRSRNPEVGEKLTRVNCKTEYGDPYDIINFDVHSLNCPYF